MTSEISKLSVKQLQQVIKLRIKMDNLQAKMDEITGGETSGAKKGSGMSASARARIGAAQTARWAKLKGTASVPAKKGRRKMNAAARAKISAAAKLRWAKAKAAGKTRL
jgi:hypothetical protein